jgi:hypothetical protein
VPGLLSHGAHDGRLVHDDDVSSRRRVFTRVDCLTMVVAMHNT